MYIMQVATYERAVSCLSENELVFNKEVANRWLVTMVPDVDL